MIEQPDIVRHIDRTFDDLRGCRLPREREWQMIADYFDPVNDFTITPRPTELRRRRLSSAVPALAKQRCTAILAGYLIDPTAPFITPNVERGLVAAGRPTALDAAGRDYLENVSWQVFSRMLQPKSGFMGATSQVCGEMVGYGAGVMWNGRKRGVGPRYRARPLRSCWFSVNDDGEVDTLYYQFTLPLHQVKKRFPNAAYVDAWRTTTETQERELVTLLHVVEPRDGGVAGVDKVRKPFAEYYLCLDKKCLLEVGGYDSFPFSIPRLNVTDGSAYGRGLCWSILPEAAALSKLQELTERGVDLRVNPILMYPARMFGKPLDRRAGAVNAYDMAGLGFQSAREALQKLDIAGDVNVGVEYQKLLIQTIEQGLFTDWMRLRETGQMTAEEVIERRELRLRSMSAFIPGVDRDLMGTAGDRTLEIMIAEGQLPAPPPSVAGAEVEWDYAGPLARAQLRSQAEAMGKLFESATIAAQLDPTSTYVVDFAESLRAVAEAYGAPTAVLRERAAVEAHRLEVAAQANDKHTAELAQAGATTLRDGGQGIASLAGAYQQQQGLRQAA